jgi:tetratricopeptide (TPR) repeat protein
MNRLILIACYVLISVATFGQNSDQELKQKLLLKGNELYKEAKYSKALPVYLELDELGSTAAPAKIGDCYREMNDLANAEKYYARAVEQKNVHHRYFLYYGQALMSNAKYEEAKEWFLKCKAADPNNASVDALITACEQAIKTSVSVKSVSNIKVQNLDINSSEADFSPYFYDKGIIFTSSRSESIIRKKDSWTNTGFLDVFYAPIHWRDTVAVVEKLKGAVNTFNFHDGPACVNKTASKMYFTRNNVVAGSATESKSGDIKLKIFSAEKTGEGFKNIVELDFNSDEYSCAYPSINADETVIYFASDKAGGLGGTDIYYSTYNKEKFRWNKPVNAGPVINTPQDERFPFIHENGTLYFASNGHIGLGGLDIFAAKPDTTAPLLFVSIQNLGSPINSSKDDFGYILDPSERTGYFSSNREGGKGNDDIYTFTSASIPINITITVADVSKENIIISIIDNLTKKLVEQGFSDEMGLYFGRLEPNKSYVIQAEKTGYITTTKSIQTTSGGQQPIQVDLSLTPENN